MQDARIYLDSQMTAVEAASVTGGHAVVFSTRCPDKETANEDAAALFSLDEDAAVLVVADGMGGGPAGEHASALAVGALENALKGAVGSTESLRGAILDGIDAANRKILAAHPNAATTLAVVEIQKRKIRPYHIGDSMILTVSLRGRVKLQTVSHSPVGYAIEAGVLNEVEAMHHEHRHLVSNVVGCPEMRIEIGSALKLRPRDTVLLATDGLFDNLHVEEIVAQIRKGDLAESIDQLAREALRRMRQPAPTAPSKPDDLTIVAFRPAPGSA